MPFLGPIVSGALAGCAVDVTLYPIDTIKTRMQSAQGFRASGGFHGVYKGVGVAFIGSMPGAAMFFLTYENLRSRLVRDYGLPQPAADVVAAPVGEVVACVIRVPVEAVKQRLQVAMHPTMGDAVRAIYRTGGAGGFYAGYRVTLMREIPFGCIQFPLYEALKRMLSTAYGGAVVPSYGAACCGWFAGATAAALTTPFDVAKTRIMLGQGKGLGVFPLLLTISKEEGAAGLFRGIAPRVTWISIGGFVFFGVYDGIIKAFSKYGQRE